MMFERTRLSSRPQLYAKPLGARQCGSREIVARHTQQESHAKWSRRSVSRNKWGPGVLAEDNHNQCDGVPQNNAMACFGVCVDPDVSALQLRLGDLSQGH